MNASKRMRILLGALALSVGLGVLVPGTAAAESSRRFGSCGADCYWDCCWVSGFFCSCYCDTDRHAVCGCTWTY